MAITKVTDVIVPQRFDPYFRQMTEKKLRLAQSGAMAQSPQIAEKLRGGGLTFSVPSWDPVDRDSAEEIVSDNEAQLSTPAKLTSAEEKQVRLYRHKSWSSMRLASALAGSDPMGAIADQASSYWAFRLQAAAIATLQGVFADNTANDSDDYTHDASGSSYAEGVTTFKASHVIDALGTMGDSWQDIALIAMHSTVFQRAQKENLIVFREDSQANVVIPTYMGREVLVLDEMPSSGGVYETWLFGAGALQYATISPEETATENAPGTEIDRKPDAGYGGGQDVLVAGQLAEQLRCPRRWRPRSLPPATPTWAPPRTVARATPRPRTTWPTPGRGIACGPSGR